MAVTEKDKEKEKGKTGVDEKRVKATVIRRRAALKPPEPEAPLVKAEPSAGLPAVLQASMPSPKAEAVEVSMPEAKKEARPKAAKKETKAGGKEEKKPRGRVRARAIDLTADEDIEAEEKGAIAGEAFQEAPSFPAAPEAVEAL
ncbi:MAG: hypothetical protein HZB21_03365, partial [Deltaproteobacteria bacterium]|nr:hypothetical protein [Deltaproteobacteria bacterium]